jgi:hypothetical protein
MAKSTKSEQGAEESHPTKEVTTILNALDQPVASPAGRKAKPKVEAPKVTVPEIRFPNIKNNEEFANFVKELDDPDRIHNSFIVTVVGMSLVANAAAKTKGKSLPDVMALPSVNYYIRKGLVNNVYVKRAIGTIVAFNTLKFFKNTGEVNAFINDCTTKAPTGRKINNIDKFPSQIGTHRGGLYMSIIGSLTTDPVYNPTKYGPKLNNLKLRDCLSCVNLGMEPDLSEQELAELVIKNLTLENKLTFADAQNYQTEGNLTSLELEIVKIGGVDFTIERLTGEDVISVPGEDPNEPGISGLERRLRLAKQARR